MHFEAVDFSRLMRDFKYYREITRKYRGKFDILISHFTFPTSEIFALANDATIKIASLRYSDLNRHFPFSLTLKLAYDKKIFPEKNASIMQLSRAMFHYFGLKDYKAKLTKLNSKPKIIQEEHYAVVAPGSASSEKCWSAERLSEIIDFIIERYDMKVHLVGAGETDRKIQDAIQVKYPERLINHIEKTSFSEWSSILQHADLFFGMDSASAHIAAAHRVKAVVITGVYSSMFFPYKVDVLESGDRLPLCIFKKVPCENCHEFGFYTGSLNPECLKRIKEGKSTICIDAVTVQEVKDAIMRIMAE